MRGRKKWEKVLAKCIVSRHTELLEDEDAALLREALPNVVKADEELCIRRVELGKLSRSPGGMREMITFSTV